LYGQFIKPVLYSRWRWRTGNCNDNGHCVDRTQTHVIGREILHACIWNADGIASCYATTHTAILFQYNPKMHRSILLHPLWRLTQLAALPFAHRAQHRTVNITLGSNMICIQTSERLFWRAHNSNRLFSYFRFSPRNICSVFEQYAIVWDAT